MTQNPTTEAGRQFNEQTDGQYIEDVLVIESEARAQGALHEALIREGEEEARATAPAGLREAAKAAFDYLAPWVADPSSRGIVPYGELVVAKLRAALAASGETEQDR